MVDWFNAHFTGNFSLMGDGGWWDFIDCSQNSSVDDYYDYIRSSRRDWAAYMTRKDPITGISPWDAER